MAAKQKIRLVLPKAPEGEPAEKREDADKVASGGRYIVNGVLVDAWGNVVLQQGLSEASTGDMQDSVE